MAKKQARYVMTRNGDHLGLIVKETEEWIEINRFDYLTLNFCGWAELADEIVRLKREDCRIFVSLEGLARAYEPIARGWVRDEKDDRDEGENQDQNEDQNRDENRDENRDTPTHLPKRP